MSIFGDEIARMKGTKKLNRLIRNFENLITRLPVQLAIKDKVEGESERSFRNRAIDIRAAILLGLARELDGQKHLFSEQEYKALFKVVATDPYPEYWEFGLKEMRENPGAFNPYQIAQIKSMEKMKEKFS